MIIWLLSCVSSSRSAAEIIFSSHFIIKYEGHPPTGIFYQLPEMLEEVYEILSQELNYSFDEAINVKVHSTTTDFIRSTGKPGWVGATYKASQIDLQPIEILRKKGILRSTLFHEVTHVFVDKISRGSCPSWLNEALALHFSGEGPALMKKCGGKFPERKNSPRVRPLGSVGVLEENLKNLKDQKSSELAYLQAYKLFQCLLKHEKEIKRLLDKLNEIDTKGTGSSPGGFFERESLLAGCKLD